MNEHKIYSIKMTNVSPIAYSLTLLAGAEEDLILLERNASISLEYYQEHELFGSHVYVYTINEGTEYIVIDPINYNCGVYQQEDMQGQPIEGGAYFADCYILFYNFALGEDPRMFHEYITLPMASEDLAYMHQDYLESNTNNGYQTIYGGDIQVKIISVSNE